MRPISLSTVLLILATPALAQTGDRGGETQTSTRDGVYTEEQARRGQAGYGEVCAACHMEDFFTVTFLQAWAGSTVGALFDIISTTMPEDNPGGLSSGQYADVLAYIFELNGIPPGTAELSPTKETLDKILIERRQ